MLARRLALGERPPHQDPLLQRMHVVRVTHHQRIMRRHPDHAAVSRRLAQHPHHRVRVLLVQVRRRLIREDHPGIVRQRTRHRDPLLLTPRKRLRETLRQKAQPQVLQDRRRPPVQTRLGRRATLGPLHGTTRQLHGQAHVLQRRQIRKQPEILEHHTEMTQPELVALLFPHRRQIPAAIEHPPRRRLRKPRQHREKRRLARAGTTRHERHPPGLQRQAHVLQDPSIRVPDPHPLGDQLRHDPATVGAG